MICFVVYCVLILISICFYFASLSGFGCRSFANTDTSYFTKFFQRRGNEKYFHLIPYWDFIYNSYYFLHLLLLMYSHATNKTRIRTGEILVEPF